LHERKGECKWRHDDESDDDFEIEDEKESKGGSDRSANASVAGAAASVGRDPAGGELTPTAVTFNARSLSLRSVLGKKKCKTIAHLVGRYDHVLVQETWAWSTEVLRDRLGSSCPGTHIAAACFGSTKLGVAIITRASVLRTHSPTVYESESPHGTGRIVSVLWTPRDASQNAEYRTTCAHLSSSGLARRAQAEEIRDNIPLAPFHILGADTNFTYRSEDTYKFSPYSPPPPYLA
jgi:hypothetical protein